MHKSSSVLKTTMRTVYLLILLVTASVALQTELLAGERLSIRLETSGTLSYSVVSHCDALHVYVAPEHCDLLSVRCYHYPMLSGKGVSNNVSLPTTRYSVNDTRLFLFIENVNLLRPSTIVYEYKNHGVVYGLFYAMLEWVFNFGTILFALIVVLLLGVVSTMLYVILREWWKTCRRTERNRENIESFLHNTVAERMVNG